MSTTCLRCGTTHFDLTDLHMDDTAVGLTTHLAARMEQLAEPGSILLSAATLELTEGYVEVKSLGPLPVKGLPAPRVSTLARTLPPSNFRMQRPALRAAADPAG